MLQFGSEHVCIEDVHIFKHCHEMTLFLLWIGTYCISCVVQQTSGVTDLSSLVRYDDSSLAAIRHVQSIIPVVRPRPNIRSHIVLFTNRCRTLSRTGDAPLRRENDLINSRRRNSGNTLEVQVLLRNFKLTREQGKRF